MLALPVVLSSAMAASSTTQHVHALTGAMYIFQTRNFCVMFELDTAGYMDWTLQPPSKKELRNQMKKFNQIYKYINIYDVTSILD
jgi:hypothetical protein